MSRSQAKLFGSVEGSTFDHQKVTGDVPPAGSAIISATAGGKTGTAQSDPKRKPFAWFTSFAPLDEPAIAVAVIVEDADIPRTDIAGGRLAAPIARAVMQAAL